MFKVKILIFILLTQEAIVVFLKYKNIKIKNMKKIKKKYSEIMHLAEIAIGRKEVVRLLKKAAKVKSILDEDLAA